MRIKTFIMAMLLATPAFAGSTMLAVRDGNGVLRTFDVTTDGSGNYVSQSVICDGTAAATCAAIVGTALKVDGSAVTQPVSGTFWQTTQPVSQVGQYPATSVPITASATGTSAATTATLAASTSIKTYICGFSIRANATAAATADSSVTGTITGTLHYTQWTAPAASGLGLTEQIFTPCIPSSAINTGIAVISAAPGTGGVVSVAAWGYQL